MFTNRTRDQSRYSRFLYQARFSKIIDSGLIIAVGYYEILNKLFLYTQVLTVHPKLFRVYYFFQEWISLICINAQK
ncbi:hypothetical protein NIES4071_78140 [Calothrix sp. NIES-4071]|nr:hypothetical protein NIES4071_78140 [Calothrix sp. NIES-4071]